MKRKSKKTDLKQAGINTQARDPYQRYPYQKAVAWIEAYRSAKAHWPTKGNCPDTCEFGCSTFCVALRDLKAWCLRPENKVQTFAPLPETP